MRWAFLRGTARQGGHLTATYRSCNFGDSATIFSNEGSFHSPQNILDNYYSVYSGAGHDLVQVRHLVPVHGRLVDVLSRAGFRRVLAAWRHQRGRSSPGRAIAQRQAGGSFPAAHGGRAGPRRSFHARGLPRRLRAWLGAGAVLAQFVPELARPPGSFPLRRSRADARGVFFDGVLPHRAGEREAHHGHERGLPGQSFWRHLRRDLRLPGREAVDDDRHLSRGRCGRRDRA